MHTDIINNKLKLIQQKLAYKKGKEKKYHFTDFQYLVYSQILSLLTDIQFTHCRIF